MRFYSFTNLYTSGIHAGIQTAHAVHEMFSKYNARRGDDAQTLEKAEVMDDWMQNHKTIIVLNGGYQSNLQRIYRELTNISAELSLPIIKWHESKEALNGALTSVAIIVPPVIYWSNDEDPLASDPEIRLYRLINSCRFAT